MKRENAIKRVKKHKSNTKAYHLVIECLENHHVSIRPCRISGRGRFAKNLDYTNEVMNLLNKCKIKYIFRNDAPRGALSGNLILLTHITEY